MDVADAGNVLKRQTLSNEWLYVPLDKDVLICILTESMLLRF